MGGNGTPRKGGPQRPRIGTAGASFIVRLYTRTFRFHTRKANQPLIEGSMIKHIRILLLSVLGLLGTTFARAEGEQFSVLLFSKTAGWHHESILAGVDAIRKLGQLHDFNVFWTEDASRVFKDEELKQ